MFLAQMGGLRETEISNLDETSEPGYFKRTPGLVAKKEQNESAIELAIVEEGFEGETYGGAEAVWPSESKGGPSHREPVAKRFISGGEPSETIAMDTKSGEYNEKEGDTVWM